MSEPKFHAILPLYLYRTSYSQTLSISLYHAQLFLPALKSSLYYSKLFSLYLVFPCSISLPPQIYTLCAILSLFICLTCPYHLRAHLSLIDQLVLSTLLLISSYLILSVTSHILRKYFISFFSGIQNPRLCPIQLGWQIINLITFHELARA